MRCFQATRFAPGSEFNRPLKFARCKQILCGAEVWGFSVSLCSWWGNVFPKSPSAGLFIFPPLKTFSALGKMENNGEQRSETEQSRGKN